MSRSLIPALRTPVLALICLAAGTTGDHAQTSESSHEARLQSVRRQIQRLQSELQNLRSRELGLLGELERLGGEIRLREAELSEVSLRLQGVERAIDRRNERIESLQRAQQGTRRYLEFRLREIYKRGPDQQLRRLIGGPEVEGYWNGLRYAAWLNRRDARALEDYRLQTKELEQERARLVDERTRLTATRREALRVRERLTRTAEQRSRLLVEIRDDRSRRFQALGELEMAASGLSGLIGELGATGPGPALDIGKFRGLLNWPAAGAISAGFGRIVHPRFRTEVPHPGLDIDAAEGSDFHAVFEGRVLFASWLRGYGLTVIIDHGAAFLSIYAHASVLLVEKDEQVLRDQPLGKVGDTGSLRGPYLYFELRQDGTPVDPAAWLRAPASRETKEG